MNQPDIEYALAKQIPDMARGFTVATSYGDITIPPGKLARHLQANMERALVRELGQLSAAALKRGYFKPTQLTPTQSAEVFSSIFGGSKRKPRKEAAAVAGAKS